MTELEKIEYARSFIDKLANGINPLDGSPVPEGDIVNNVRLSRCFFYVSDILRRVIENGGTEDRKREIRPKTRRASFALPPEARGRFQISQAPISVSEIANHINSFINAEEMRRLSAATISNWLLGAGLLEVVSIPNGSRRKVPTHEGGLLGIITEERNGQYGTYLAVLFKPQAQQFIYDNIDAIIGSKNNK